MNRTSHLETVGTYGLSNIYREELEEIRSGATSPRSGRANEKPATRASSNSGRRRA
jgi:hypothetical protein